MRYLSVCSGIEAASVAWRGLRWTPVGFSEIDPFASAVLQHRFPAVHNFGDLTRHEQWTLEPGAVDLLVGGTPCQSFSVAGLRAGMADPRGNLALTFLAVADRLRPEWIVWENVPGVLSSNGGRDFGAFLGALGKLGYGFAYRVLDAQYFGVAQRRRRVFVVANRTDWRRAAAVLFEPKSLQRHPAEIADEAVEDSLGDRVCAEIPELGDELERSGGGGPAAAVWWNRGRVSQTLDAVLYKKQAMPEKNRFPAVLVPAWVECPDNEGEFICQLHGENVADCSCPPVETWAEYDLWPYEPSLLRFITPLEAERLQGFEEDWTSVPFNGKPATDTPRYKAIGNSMAVPVMRWIGERIAAVDEVTR